MQMPWSARPHHAAGVLACAALLAYAVYAERVLGLVPCPLCMFQRLAVAATGLGFLLAFLIGAAPQGRSQGRWLVAVIDWRRWAGIVLPGLPALAGIGLAGRHVWLQSLPPSEVPACGPGLGFLMDAFPLKDVIARVLTGSGQCAEIDWTLWGLSMPAWVLAACTGLLAWALASAWTRRSVRRGTFR